MQAAGVGWHRLRWTSRRIVPGIVVRHGVLRAPAEQVHEAIVSRSAFRGRVEVIHDGSVAGQHTASAVAAAQRAALVVNGGFFIVTGSDGYPGAPAGLAVYHGQLESMSAGARGALVLGDGPPRIEHLISTASVAAGGSSRPVQGINRLPGVIENCGRPGSRPFRAPRQDFTCDSRSELVLFTPQLGAATPSGPGEQVVVGPRGTVRWAGPGAAARSPPAAWSSRASARPPPGCAGTRGPAATWRCASGSPTAAASRCRCGTG